MSCSADGTSTIPNALSTFINKILGLDNRTHTNTSTLQDMNERVNAAYDVMLQGVERGMFSPKDEENINSLHDAKQTLNMEWEGIWDECGNSEHDIAWRMTNELFQQIEKGMNTGVFDTKKIKKLINDGADVNAKLDQGENLLSFALMYADFDVVKIIIDKGADINESGYGGTMIMYLLTDEPDIDKIAYFIKKGADIYQPTDFEDSEYTNMSFIDLLINRGDIKTFMTLFKKGLIDINKIDLRFALHNLGFIIRNHPNTARDMYKLLDFIITNNSQPYQPVYDSWFDPSAIDQMSLIDILNEFLFVYEENETAYNFIKHLMMKILPPSKL